MTSDERKTRRPAKGATKAAWLAAIMISLLGPSCTEDEPDRHPDDHYSEDCRFAPDLCGGDLGALCVDDYDCGDGHCCTEEANCAGGMCSLPCDNDGDCPSFMACEHHTCFFRCDHDDDCAEGQSCEHGETICEWP
jgi:hypothetical protein